MSEKKADSCSMSLLSTEQWSRNMMGGGRRWEEVNEE